jgi:hypothetical protein
MFLAWQQVVQNDFLIHHRRVTRRLPLPQLIEHLVCECTQQKGMWYKKIQNVFVLK